MFCFYKRTEKIIWFFIGFKGIKKTAKNKTNEIIKRELLNSMQENDDVEGQGLNKTANNDNNSQKAIIIINRYEDFVKM